MLKPIHWSPELAAREVYLEPGTIVSGVDDIAQCIRIILETPKGTDPLRPLFGSDHFLYLDRPLPAAVPQIVREAWDAIATWEPRAVLERITVETASAHAVLYVHWHPVDGEKTEVLRVG
jgi:phage baseplate assembly protein W